MKRGIILFFFYILTLGQAYGEYRVYQYYVRSKVMNINSGNATLITSTLDPISYAAYHGGKSSIEVNLLRSWMCMGNTAQKSVCTIGQGSELSDMPPAPIVGVVQ